DATTDYVTYDLNYVCLANTGDTPVPIPYGVALGTITTQYYAWFQIGGFCPFVRAIGSTDAVVAGQIIMASSTAGTLKGPTAAGMSAIEASKSFGIALIGYAAGDAAAVGVPALLRCHSAF
ncbi:MAG: hypothetical protein KKH44_03180, partial [Bacteroidetes bacterium]|nr:hypothetical protein [Bacteroidota bacterium]